MSMRLTLVAVAFALVISAFGVPRSPLAPLAVPAAVLTGVAFSAPLMAYAGAVKTGEGFNVVFRFIITPLFLFSGVFFPVSRLPEPLQLVAWCTPLFHGVELVRGLTARHAPVAGLADSHELPRCHDRTRDDGCGTDVHTEIASVRAAR